MTAKSEILDNIRRCFSIWSSDLNQNGKVNRLSDHISSEDIAAGLLNLIYGYNLRNANEVHPKYSWRKTFGKRLSGRVSREIFGTSATGIT